MQPGQVRRRAGAPERLAAEPERLAAEPERLAAERPSARIERVVDLTARGDWAEGDAAPRAAAPPASGSPVAGPPRPDPGRTHAQPADAPTWDEIADRYGSTVYTMAYRLTGDRDEARDLAQDVFVRVYRNLDRYRPGTFEGWLYRITKNLFLDRIRRRSRVTVEPWPVEEWRQPSDPDPGPEEQAEGHILGEPLEHALAQLPPSFRAAVVMCDVQGLTYEEIADSTGWPIGTVRSRIHRGRRLLRTHLGGDRDRHG